MKKLFVPLMCFLLLAFVSSTGARMNMMITCSDSGSGGAAACSGNYPNTDTEATAKTEGSGVILLQRIALGCDGSSANIWGYHKYCTTDTREIIYVWYEDNGSGTDPGDLIGQSTAFYDDTSDNSCNTSSDDWCQKSVSGSVSGEPTYVWIGLQFEDTNCRAYYDNDGVSRQYDGTWGVIPDPWPTGSDETETKDLGFYIAF
jgi:hypothetical protein